MRRVVIVSFVALVWLPSARAQNSYFTPNGTQLVLPAAVQKDNISHQADFDSEVVGAVFGA